jgi:hypothetical protein
MATTDTALAVLAELPRAEVSTTVGPAMVSDPSASGVLVTERADGGVVAYWFAGGRYQATNGEPHETALDTMGSRLERAGWTVERGIFHVRAWAPIRDEWIGAECGQQLTLAGMVTDAQQGALFA